jgi:hypothetical protein
MMMEETRINDSVDAWVLGVWDGRPSKVWQCARREFDHDTMIFFMLRDFEMEEEYYFIICTIAKYEEFVSYGYERRRFNPCYQSEIVLLPSHHKLFYFYPSVLCSDGSSLLMLKAVIHGPLPSPHSYILWCCFTQNYRYPPVPARNGHFRYADKLRQAFSNLSGS